MVHPSIHPHSPTQHRSNVGEGRGGVVPYLDGLPEAALPQHLPVDEVGGAEDAVRAARDQAQRLGPVDVLTLEGGGVGLAGARGLVGA